MQLPMNPKFCEAGLCGYFPQMPYSYNAVEDARLKAEWANQYYQASIAYNDAVVSALRAMGFAVDVIGNACLPSAGCYGLALYGAVMKKNGKQMDTNIGFGTRFDSPQQEAEYLAMLFERNAISTQTEWQSGQGTSVYSGAQVSYTPSSGAGTTAGAGSNTSAGSTAGASSKAGAGTSDSGSSASTVSNKPLSASISAPDGYVVGRSWRITVTGPALQPVSVHAYQNGKDLGRTQYGRTDSNGVFDLSGSFTPGVEGGWVEYWYVGDSLAGVINFVVSPAATAPQPGESAANNVDSGSSLKTPSRESNQAEGIELETGGVRVAVGGIPSWIWLAAAAAGGYLLLNANAGGKR